MGNTLKKNEGKLTKKQQRQFEKERQKRSRRLMGWTLSIIVLVCIGFIIFRAFTGTNEAKGFDQSIFQYEKQPFMGSKNAPVKVVEFADFKCPSCKQFDQMILPQLKKELIDNGTVQYFFINYPIISPNADSKTAAMAGEAIYHQNPEEFWKFYEAVYAHQGDEKQNWATSDALVQIAKDANVQVDYDKMKKDIDTQVFSQDVSDDAAIGDKVGVNGTPTIFINGKEVSENDTFNYDAIKAAIMNAKGS